MRDLILEGEISDILIDMLEDYHETADEWNRSDLQGWCEAKAFKIVEIVKSKESLIQ